MTTGATAAVKGGFWPENGVVSLSSSSGKGPGRRRIAQLLGTKGMRADRELLLTLTGAAAGSAASDTNSRVEASTELGGRRTIETETLVGRNTTAGDATELVADLMTLSTRTYDPTPVANGDGNPLGTR